jgi:hypothetical protein
MPYGKGLEIPEWLKRSLILNIPSADEDRDEETCACRRSHKSPQAYWPPPAGTLPKKMGHRPAKRHTAKDAKKIGNTFRFTDLPYELRRKVWDICEPEVPTSPRTIGFIASSQDDFVRAFAKIPTLLHTCGETREEALKHYKLCFSLICGGRPVYIDFEIDRLYMYTARTFRRFFAYGHAVFDYKLNNESKIFQSKTRCLILNCASISLPQFLPDAGFRNLQTLVVAGGKRDGNWSKNTQQMIKANYRPERDKDATEFEIVVLDQKLRYAGKDKDRYWRYCGKQFFENMVGPFPFPLYDSLLIIIGMMRILTPCMLLHPDRVEFWD